MLTRWTRYVFGDGRLLDEANEGNGGAGGSGNSGDNGAKPKEGEGGDADDSEGGEGDDKKPKGKKFEELDPEAQKIIKDLRKENSTLRNRAKTSGEKSEKLLKALKEAGLVDDESEDPAEKLKTVSTQLEGTSHRAAILEAALEHEVPKASVEYFEFLVQKKLTSLKEGEELTDEDLASLALEAKQKSGVAPKKTGAGVGQAPAQNGQGGQAPAGDSDMTAQKFAKLSMGEKSALYAKNPDAYNRLFKEAKEKRFL